MRFSFTVEVEVERASGKFASREDIAEVIQEWLEGANEDEVYGVGSDGDSTYIVSEWTVSRWA